MNRAPVALVIGLGLAELVAWGAQYYAFSVVTVAMQAELGWAPGWSSAAFALGIVVSGLTGVPLGRHIARHGSRTVMVCGASLGAVGLAAWSTVDRPVELLAAFAVVGAAMSATLYEPAFAVLASSGRDRAGIVVVTALGGLGGAVFLPLTGFLVGEVGWRGALRVLAVVVALLAVALLALPAGRSAGRSARPATAEVPGAPATPPVDPSPAVRWLTVAVTLSSACKAGLVVDMVALIAARGVSLRTASLAAGAAGLTQVAGRLFSVLARRHAAEHHVTAAVFLAQACAAVPLLVLPHDAPGQGAAIVVWVLLTGAGFGLPELLRGTWLADLVPSASYPVVNGRIALPVNVARATGPLLVGVAVTLTAAHTAVLVGGSLLALAAALAALAAGRASRVAVH